MDEDDFFEIVYRIINKYNGKTKKPRQYGSEHLLYSSEVHMIEVIGGHDSVTATQLASLQGITKGAVSQTTRKLLQKGLIQKDLSPAGNNEVLISLTGSGKTVYQNHLSFHQKLTSEISALVRELPQASLDIIQKMLHAVDDALDQY